MKIVFAFRACLFLHLLAAFTALHAADGYDPLSKPAKAEARHHDFEVTDASRDRKLPVRVWLPASEKAEPVLIFSHGLGGNREGAAYLASHWTARGYVVVCLQHPGSDDAVWKSAKAGERLPAMRQAASGENLLLRAGDVPAALDQLERWNTEKGHALFGKMDFSRVGMSGHSFGAMTTQLLAGQTLVGKSFADSRVKAAVVMSPSPFQFGDPKRALAGLKMPCMLMTGTLDDSPIGNTSPEERRLVYPALPPGDKYELVLDKARHGAFSDRALPGEGLRRNPNHHKVILALSTAFWDAYLRGDAGAKTWLAGEAPRALMNAADVWQKK
ncbi:MAG: alpha/beta hydrolase family protein [Verrucomicrobiales bacterium]